jgi:hypothetical protein
LLESEAPFKGVAVRFQEAFLGGRARLLFKSECAHKHFPFVKLFIPKCDQTLRPSLPPTNETITASGAGTIGFRQIAPRSAWAQGPKKYCSGRAAVNTANATRLVRKDRPDGSPFKVREFIPHDSRPWFGRLDHAQTDAFNRKNGQSAFPRLPYAAQFEPRLGRVLTGFGLNLARSLHSQWVNDQ